VVNFFWCYYPIMFVDYWYLLLHNIIYHN
jgi:hypothetical protein